MNNLKIHIDDNEFIVNPFQFKGIWDHIATGKWEPETFTVFKKFIKETDVVIDIGSWAGPLTIYAAHLASFVHSIDPDPVIFKQLEHNVNLNPEIGNKVKCHNLAIWNDNSAQTLFARNIFGDSASSLIQRTRDGNKSVTVNAISFKEFLRKEKIEGVDFIKMDIEGAEFFILPSLKDVLMKLQFPTLLISFHTEYLRECLFQIQFRIKFISKLLFKIYRVLGRSLFSKKIGQTVSDSIMPLNEYKFIYETNGKSIHHGEVVNYINGSKTSNFVFTNREW